jgi:uridylate kinase
MKKKVIVLSLGGSLIIPNDVDYKFLKEFKKTLLKNTKKYKFIVVCGGGSLARKYIKALQEERASIHLQGLAGISATRTNARFMNYFFHHDSESGIPHKIKHIKKILKKQDIVFCGALNYKTGATSDSNAVEIAAYFKTYFINLTNVQGLYDKNPKKHKNAKFISNISWKAFYNMASKIAFKPGQHFVLDQSSAKIIMDKKIKTHILGKNMKNLDSFLKGKKFKATIIQA